eukprot:373872_1
MTECLWFSWQAILIMTPSYFILRVLNICCFIGYTLMNAYSIDCSVTQCHNAFINCIPSEDCFISCAGAHECAGSIINCPVNGNCTVYCLGDQSCSDTTIDATLSEGSLTVNCGDDHAEKHSQSTDHCKTIKIFGSTLRESPGDIIVQCNGNCMNSNINCAFFGDCHIFCDGNCQHSHITGPIFGDLAIDCNAEGACINGIFNGAVSSKLSITGCQSYQSCLDLTLYCPPNTDGDMHCFIEGNDNLGIYRETSLPTISPATHSPTISPAPNPTNAAIGNGIAIYAKHGWKDIAVNYTGTFGESHGGTMFCGDTYDATCDFAANAWSCGAMHYACNGNDGIMFKPSRTTQATSVSAIDYVQNDDKTTAKPLNGDVRSTSTDYSYISTKESEGDVFILICVGCVVLTLIGVGFAQIRKNMMDQSKASQTSLYRQHSFRPQPAQRSASFRRQHSVSRSSRQKRHKHSSFRDKHPKEIPSDYDSILL